MPETKMPEPQPGPQPGRWVLSHGEIRTIVFGLMLAMFLAALNQTIVATALPTIGRDFRDFELLPWIVTAYLLVRPWSRRCTESSATSTGGAP
jgi:hypothetical protein